MISELGKKESMYMKRQDIIMTLYVCVVKLAVYKEVERRVANFRDMLHKRLLDPNNTLDEQKKLIRWEMLVVLSRFFGMSLFCLVP